MNIEEQLFEIVWITYLAVDDLLGRIFFCAFFAPPLPVVEAGVGTDGSAASGVEVIWGPARPIRGLVYSITWLVTISSLAKKNKN